MTLILTCDESLHQTRGETETLGAEDAQAVTTGAGAVHEHARDQAQQAGDQAQETSRSFSSPQTAAAGFSEHSGMTQIEQATRVVTDAGLATSLTSKITELVRHAAEVSAASELELLSTAAAARQLLDSCPSVQAVPTD